MESGRPAFMSARAGRHPRPAAHGRRQTRVVSDLKPCRLGRAVPARGLEDSEKPAAHDWSRRGGHQNRNGANLCCKTGAGQLARGVAVGGGGRSPFSANGRAERRRRRAAEKAPVLPRPDGGGPMAARFKNIRQSYAVNPRVTGRAGESRRITAGVLGDWFLSNHVWPPARARALGDRRQADSSREEHEFAHPVAVGSTARPWHSATRRPVPKPIMHHQRMHSQRMHSQSMHSQSLPTWVAPSATGNAIAMAETQMKRIHDAAPLSDDETDSESERGGDTLSSEDQQLLSAFIQLNWARKQRELSRPAAVATPVLIPSETRRFEPSSEDAWRLADEEDDEDGDCQCNSECIVCWRRGMHRFSNETALAAAKSEQRAPEPTADPSDLIFAMEM